MRRIFLISCVVFVLGVLASATVLMVCLYSSYGNAIHMRGVTKRLAEWQVQYGQEIRDDRQARSAIEMLDYIQWYYVPQGSYHADPDTEDALQSQRLSTMETIAEALGKYSGKEYGVEVDRWREWLDRRRASDNN